MTRAVEVIGVAGSGKSTLLAEIGRKHRDVIRTVDSARTGGALKLWATAGRAVVGTAIAWGRPPSSLQVARWWARLGTFDVMLRSDDPRTAWFDQGPGYTLARLSQGPLSPAAEAWWEREAQRWAARLDALVSIDADDDVLLQRIERRQKGHALRGRATDEALAGLRRGRDQLTRTAARLEVLGVPVIRVDTGSGSAEQLADALVDQAVAIVGASPSTSPRRPS